MIRLALLLGLLSVSLLAPSTAGAARSEFFGIVQGATLDGRDLQGLARARVRTDRFMLNWGWVQPSSAGSFHWAGTDRLIGALASHRIRAAPAFWGNPSWVYGASSRPPIDRPGSVQAWRAFLKAAVARYGPNGAYWRTRYHEVYGSRAIPLPIQAWQIWNEPNLKKFFGPSSSPSGYAQLLRISHNAIKSEDPDAQIVLAGMPGYGDINAWEFLRHLYSVDGVKAYFDAAALHPYGHDLDQSRQEIERFRAVMSNHADASTPLWITEIGWGSAPPDRFGINKGLDGQKRLLRRSYTMVLNNRRAWNVQRLFWFHWRDPREAQPGTCSFCGSAGLLKHNRIPKPALAAFTGFTAETTPPSASIVSGPDGPTSDPTPTFRFTSSEAGSTFECRIVPQAYHPCMPPLKSARLEDGAHRFSVRAIDAPGNESVAVSRSFTVDTVAPRVTITSGPANGSTSQNTQPSFSFSANEPDVSFHCQLDSGGFAPCTSPHPTGQLANGQHTFEVEATDPAGNVGPVTARTWTIGPSAAAVRMVSGPGDGSISSDATPTFRFASSQAGSRFWCRLDSARFSACSSPYASRRLDDGRHAFRVRAAGAAGNIGVPLEIDFTIDTTAPRLRIDGPSVVTRTRRTKRSPSATFALRASEHVALRCRIASRHFEPCPRRYRTPRLAKGPHTLKVKATDRAGNVAARRKRFRIGGTSRPPGRRGGRGHRPG